MKQINEQRRRNFELRDDFVTKKINNLLSTTHCYQTTQRRKNQFQVKSFFVLLIVVVYSSHAVTDAFPANDASYDSPSKKLSDQLSLMRYFPGLDEAWDQMWSRKLIQELIRNNLLNHDSREAEKTTGVPSSENSNDVQSLENSFLESGEDEDVMNDDPENNKGLVSLSDNWNKLKRVPSYNSWRKGKRGPSYNSWRKGKRVPSYNSWRKGKRVPSYNSWRKGKRSNWYNSGLKRNTYTAWRKGKRGPSYNSWRKGKRGPSYNSWRKGKRSTANNHPINNLLGTLFLAKEGHSEQTSGEGYYDPYWYESDEQGNDDKLQEEDALTSLPSSDQLVASTNDQREKRQIQVDPESPGDKEKGDDKEPTERNTNRGTGEVYELLPDN